MADKLSNMPPLITRTSVLNILHDRISILETGVSSEELRSSLPPNSDNPEEQASPPGDFDAANMTEINLPRLTEQDTSQSTITIDDVAWGRQSKRIFATNKNNVTLPALPRKLSYDSEQDWELPTESQARVLVAFHTEYLCWLHNTLYTPDFLDACEAFWKSGITDHPLWFGLYLSIMSVSAWCLPPHLASELWPQGDQKKQATKWYSGMIYVLYSNDFIGQHSLYSIQAIVISNLVSYVLGHSDLQTVLIATAIRIAQCMGLDRQNPDEPPADARSPYNGDLSSWKARVSSQTARRIWWQLIIQDYFEIAFANNYIVRRDRFCTPMPTNCDDHDLMEQPESVPTVSSYCIALAKIACLMPSLVDKLNSNLDQQPIEDRYPHVLEMDLKMRDLVSSLPAFLKRTEPEDPAWPTWVSWARSTLTISAADKIIMIHRSFMIKSFRESRYTYTRVTCVSAALTILREYDRIKHSNVASVWVVPAFTISAAIIIMLDLLHKSVTDETTLARRGMVQSVVTNLEQDKHNVMSMRGSKLLRALLNREIEMREAQVSPQDDFHCSFDNEIFGPPPQFAPNIPGDGEDGSLPFQYGAFESWFEGSVPYFSSTSMDLPYFEGFH
ncbi:hypothetical protein H2204_000846 [Knufia peltigerae]|uniref:Xylanolytic transcriptional activator regulatory domain-containing protein n=1 Tax=Knufia peltigerae TaxID=1002370 RepID=A0AA38YE79_9EURO|nr:hypothetical protein H2204_000846 [Knufia peltigerae]